MCEKRIYKLQGKIHLKSENNINQNAGIMKAVLVKNSEKNCVFIHIFYLKGLRKNDYFNLKTVIY